MHRFFDVVDARSMRITGSLADWRKWTESTLAGKERRMLPGRCAP